MSPKIICIPIPLDFCFNKTFRRPPITPFFVLHKIEAPPALRLARFLKGLFPCVKVTEIHLFCIHFNIGSILIQMNRFHYKAIGFTIVFKNRLFRKSARFVTAPDGFSRMRHKYRQTCETKLGLVFLFPKIRYEFHLGVEKQRRFRWNPFLPITRPK